MTKKKNKSPEAWDTAGPAGGSLMEGHTWCPECQAAFTGEVCPGCVDLSGAQSGEILPQAGAQSAPSPDHPAPEAAGAIQEAGCVVHQFVENEDDGSFVCEKCGRTLGEGETPPGPTTLAEVAEQASVETTAITEILPVPISDAQYKEFGILVSRANQEIAQAEDELKAVKSQFKSRIDAAEARRNDFASIINAGHQQRQVECHLVKDFAANTITLIRLDTGEVVRTRTMTAAEKQRGLAFEE
jgi:hypothetical protein